MILEGDGRTKPPFGATLDRGHWAAQGLRAFFAFNERNSPTVRDLARRVTGTFTNSPTWVAGSRWGGPAIKFGAAGSSYIDLGNPAALDFTTGPGLTVVWSYQCDAKPNFVNRYFLAGNGVVIDCAGPTSGGPRFVLNGGGGAGGFIAESRTVVDGEQYTYAITYDRTSKFSQIIREGVVTTTTTMSAFGDIPAPTGNWNIGSSAGSLAWDGSIHWMMLFDRVLPLGQIAFLQSRPFAILTARRPLSIFLGSTGLTWSVSDSAAATDAITNAFAASVTDSAAATESPADATAASVTDSASATESLASAWAASITDTATLTESATGSGFSGAALTWSTSDSATATDAIGSAWSSSLTDSASATESVAKLIGWSVTDSASVTESLTSAWTTTVADFATCTLTASGSGFTTTTTVTTALLDSSTITVLSTDLDYRWSTITPL